MKRRLSLTQFMCALAVSAVSFSGPATQLSAQEALNGASEAELQAAGAVVSQAPVAVQVEGELPAAPQVNATAYLNPLTQEQWVVLDQDGRLYGKYVVLTPNGEVRGVAGVTINLGRNGVVIHSAVSEPDGSFSFNAVGVGAYALVAQSPSSIAAHALHVLPTGASEQLDSDLAIFGTSIAGPVVGEILRAHLVPRDPTPGYYPALEFDPYGEGRLFQENVTVQLTAQGVLTGHISRPNGRSGGDLSGNVVHILQGGRVVGHVPTNAVGDFQVPGVAPGAYDYIIAGKDGVAAGSFRAVAADGLAQQPKAETHLVSAVNNQNGPPNGLNVELVAPIDWLAGEPEFILPPEEELAMAPVAGGGMVGPGGFGAFGGGGGGMGGGGAGAGGIGGLGGLLGIAGLAAGIAAAASDDEGFFIASPQ